MAPQSSATTGQHRRFLYLDFDGVLHPADVWLIPGQGFRLGASSEGHTLFEHANLLAVNLPFGITIAVNEDRGAAISASKLEREFYLPDDEIGSKSEVAAAAFECLLLALMDAGFEMDSPQGHRAIQRAVALTVSRL